MVGDSSAREIRSMIDESGGLTKAFSVCLRLHSLQVQKVNTPSARTDIVCDGKRPKDLQTELLSIKKTTPLIH